MQRYEEKVYVNWEVGIRKSENTTKNEEQYVIMCSRAFNKACNATVKILDTGERQY